MNSTAGETLFLPSTLKTETASLPGKPYNTHMNAHIIWVPCPTLDPALDLYVIEMGGREGQHELT